MSVDTPLANERTPHEVWGITVPIDNYGRRRWPNEIKEMAVQRVVAGSTISELAREMDIAGCTLGKWIRKSRSHKETSSLLVEVGIHDAAEGSQIVDDGIRRSDCGIKDLARSSKSIDECVLQLGSFELKFDARISSSNLVAIIRAITASSG